jgi:hypothetical protein
MSDPFIESILGKFGDNDPYISPIMKLSGAVGPTPAPLPVATGVIPNTRPKGSTPTQRKEDLKNLISDALGGDLSQYNQEVLAALIEAMNAYVENQIG